MHYLVGRAVFLYCILPVTFCKEWTYLMLAQQWVISTCLQYPTHGCNIFPNVTSWTVHGLWVSDSSGQPIDNCGGPKFDVNKLQSILPSLYKNWVSSFADETVYMFLKHEWQKHGTCVVNNQTFNNELDYFSIGLRLQKEYDIYSALSSQGIVPSATNQYTLEIIKNSLVKAFKVIPKITCTDKDKTKVALYQIKICLDEMLKPINCFSNGTNCPPKGLWYLPLHPQRPFVLPVVLSVVIIGLLLIISIIVFFIRKRRAIRRDYQHIISS